MTTPPPDAPLTDEQPRDEWSHALQYIHEDDRTVLEYARTWADSWSVDYDEGPCAIEFKKDGASYWYLIDDIGWDADDPRTELIVEALRELKAAREELRALKLTDHDLREMPLTELQQVQANLSAILTERDALRDQLTTMTRERDEARANAALEAQHHHHLRAERDSLRAQVADFSEHHASLVEKTMEVDALRARLAECELARHEAEQLAESRFAWAHQVAERTKEQIAAWLDARSHAHGARVHQIKARIENGDIDEHGWAESYASGWAQDIRAGAWRASKEQP